jgi:hypothetical protein
MRVASELPGPGAYDIQNNDWGRGGFSMYGKMMYGNYQTTMPDAVQYHANTLPASSASTYRRDSSCSRQIDSTKPSSPSVRFAGKSFRQAQKERMEHNALKRKRDLKFRRMERARALSDFDPIKMRDQRRKGIRNPWDHVAAAASQGAAPASREEVCKRRGNPARGRNTRQKAPQWKSITRHNEQFKQESTEER